MENGTLEQIRGVLLLSEGVGIPFTVALTDRTDWNVETVVLGSNGKVVVPQM